MTVSHADSHPPMRFEARYFTDELPTDPLRILLVGGDGVPRDLSNVDAVTVDASPELPACTAKVHSPSEGLIDVSWLGKFETAGRFMLMLKMHSGERVDFAPPSAVVVVARAA